MLTAFVAEPPLFVAVTVAGFRGDGGRRAGNDTSARAESEARRKRRIHGVRDNRATGGCRRIVRDGDSFRGDERVRGVREGRRGDVVDLNIDDDADRASGVRCGNGIAGDGRDRGRRAGDGAGRGVEC